MSEDVFDRKGEEIVEPPEPIERDVFVEPCEIVVEIDPDFAPGLYAPRKDARFPFPIIQVYPKVLPVEEEVTVAPSLFGTFHVDYAIRGIIEVTPEVTGDFD